jgi:hypothetical protein
MAAQNSGRKHRSAVTTDTTGNNMSTESKDVAMVAGIPAGAP